GEVAEGGDVGVVLAGRRCRSIGAAAVGAGSAGRQETQPAHRGAGAVESPSSHDVLLRIAAPRRRERRARVGARVVHSTMMTCVARNCTGMFETSRSCVLGSMVTA